MINQVFVLSKETGALIYHRAYEKQEIDPSLIGGFLSAMGNIANERLEGNGGIDSIRMKDERWVYFIDENLYFIINSDLIHPPSRLKHKLRYISKEFVELYPKSIIQNWNGDTEMFNKFDGILDKLLKDWDHAHQTTTDTKAMDIIGLYENILHRLFETKISRSKKESLLSNVDDMAMNIFSQSLCNEKTGQLDLFRILTEKVNYQDLRVGLKKLFNETFQMITQLADRDDVENIIKKRLFPLFTYYYRNIDLYNLDQAIFPPIFEYMSR
jgi:hypothetical protein